MSEPTASKRGEWSAADGPAGVRAQLDGLADLELADHPDVYQRIHADLQEALAGIDDA